MTRISSSTSRALQFDVFLAHNTKDKPFVLEISEKLKQHELETWIDRNNILTGESFQREIQKAIRESKSAAIFLGKHGVGDWQGREIEAILNESTTRKMPVIPVLLPGVDGVPEEFPFLKSYNWVKFRSPDDKAALEDLIRGIKGELRKSAGGIHKSPLGKVKTIGAVLGGTALLLVALVIGNHRRTPPIPPTPEPSEVGTSEPSVHQAPPSNIVPQSPPSNWGETYLNFYYYYDRPDEKSNAEYYQQRVFTGYAGSELRQKRYPISGVIYYSPQGQDAAKYVQSILEQQGKGSLPIQLNPNISGSCVEVYL